MTIRKSEFLLEIFSEEIPARMQAKAADDLKNIITGKLKDAGLKFAAATPYVTARRLTLHIEGLDAEQPDISEERRGPRADAPERAVEGFLKSVGMSRDQVELRETKKGIFLFAVIEKKGRKTSEVLSEFLPEIIRTFPWLKSMRWGAGSLRWVRPMHSIIALFDGEVVDFTVGDEVSSSNVTKGHRFLGADEFTVTNFADYKEGLAKRCVVLDMKERKLIILEAAQKLAADEGLKLVDDPALLIELAGLSEYPLPVLGKFDEKYLAVPPEALTSAMRTHQKYFSLTSPDGKLANRFITVSNMKTDDNQAAIISGNERVLNARLADTKFFWDQDLKSKLEDHLPKLDQITFHAKLGTVGERVSRLSKLSAYIAEKIGADVSKASEAAWLSKSDLVTGMVDECPELQGLMGKYFADAEGLDAEIGQAIADQYSPKGPSDECPTAPVSIAVALAEKIDTLLWFFAMGKKPTGSKDPFALRRAGLGVIRLILENNLGAINLRSIFSSHLRSVLEDKEKLSFRSNLVDIVALEWVNGKEEYTVIGEVTNFIADRLKVHLKSEGVRHDLITAVFSQAQESDLVRLLERVNVLQTLIDSDDGKNLLAGYKRAANILTIEEKKDSAKYNGAADFDMMELAQEKTLFKALTQVEGQVKKAVDGEKFDEAMTSLATLREPIDAFFEDVIVNSSDKNERLNRLKLLSQIRTTMNLVADFNKIEG